MFAIPLDDSHRISMTYQVREIVADFVVIGGGSAGCVVAARLAEYGFETLLLSSGFNDTENPLMRQKSLFNQLFKTSQFKHYLPPDPLPTVNNRILDIAVWNTLGGSSVNGGGMGRMMAHEWDSFILATGDQSYNHQNMSKYYKMAENFTSNERIFISDIHGHTGPIKITMARDALFDSIWKKVADEVSETFSDDLAGTTDYGFSFEPSSYTNGLRSWSGDAYLTPAILKYPNLRVITGATVTKLEMKNGTKQINNVLFVSPEGLFSAVARKEYILSAGTFYTPHILMLSGIGDPDILQRSKIAVKHVLKQVGKNLMDNGGIVAEFETKDLPIDQCIPIALVNSQSQTTKTNTNTFLIFKMNNITKHLRVTIYNASPTSKLGSVSLHNANPFVPPKITLNYLEDPNDIKTFVDGINYIRKIMSTKAIKQYAQVTEIAPGIQEMNLPLYIKNNLTPAYHFMGTCSMGKNAENSVVDNYFKMHGIRNLRIVDASVFPIGFASKIGPCLTVYALAEKAAHLLQQEYS